jgi:predicted ATPase
VKILSVELNGKEYKLSDGGSFADDTSNIFTIIIGNNGAGKSRLLNNLTSVFQMAVENKFQPMNIPRRYTKAVTFTDRKKIYNLYTDKKSKKKLACIGDLKRKRNSIKRIGNGLIAVATSPFDKFPLEHKGFRENCKKRYHYVGLKETSETYSTENQLKLFARAVIDNGHNSRFKELFRLLGYSDIVDIEFKEQFSRLLGYENATIANMISRDERMFFELASANNDVFNRMIMRSIVGGEHIKAKSMFKKDNLKSFKNKYHSDKNSEDKDEFLKALDTGFSKVHKVTLRLADGSGKVDFSDASSGERCMLLMLLSIASVISDDSIICIDEPEISLHPEWQIGFIPLLKKSFSSFKNCHFIIATHSPHIASQVESDDSHILRMDDNQLFSAKEYHHKSADFQLAKLFRAPGYNNEFLIGECLDVLSNLSSISDLTPMLISRMSELISIKYKLEENDPVLSLISTIDKAKALIEND